MRSEFSGKHVQYVLVYPSAFGERGEREIIRIDFSQTWEGENKNRQLQTSFRAETFHFWRSTTSTEERVARGR